MNQWLWEIFYFKKTEVNYDIYKKMKQLDSLIFQGWLKKTYWIFTILNLLYLSTYEIINDKYKIKPNYKPKFEDITIYTAGSNIPMYNIFQLCISIGEDINLIRKKRGELYERF